MDNRTTDEIMQSIRKIQGEISDSISSFKIKPRVSPVLNAIVEMQLEREDQIKLGVL